MTQTPGTPGPLPTSAAPAEAGADPDDLPVPPRVEITYCTQCRWLLRAAWIAQELLTTFGTRLGEVALVPGTGGVFTVRIGDDLVWDRSEQKGFPEIPALKQLVRDRAAPGMSLGHTDRSAAAAAGTAPGTAGPSES
ncbi:hypothetical protein GCM10025865_20720 [Paraoerskovia sediminicola]|uniref:Selenoprotein W-related protein n=1 Tax=Paraoerskovia sediminicola TaxID=1138587 RepID=A0ABN6XH32_9CELL|nr:SelT/SelW/SelH family protein [Paraoerskovia sediminicola]BDZ42773.1 hypothetical protein GCM10025865_20720 [Paraoerskovia sediminicola]